MDRIIHKKANTVQKPTRAIAFHIRTPPLPPVEVLPFLLTPED